MQQIARVLWVIFGLNLVVALAKLLYGHRTGAVALTADGVHSLLDASGNVVALVGIHAARRPPDANHPYGHRKYETFAALGVAAMMFIACWEIGTAALDRLRHPHAPTLSLESFIVLGLTLAVNVVVVLVEQREGERLRSELLRADAAHTRSDVYATALVFASFLAAWLHVPRADGVAAVIILGLVLHAGFEIVKGTFSTLSDEARIAPGDVEDVALREAGVMEAHNVRSRGPADDIHLDLHVLVDPRMAIADAHAVGHRVERRLRETFPGLTDVVVHVEPALESERARVREGGGLKAEG
jgi:cation diffusion facilitator family transporter